jgi:hypothetical protein
MTPRFDRLAYLEPCPSPLLIHAVGLVNQWILLPHVLRVRVADFPAPDLARLRSVVRPGCATFLAPCHPEFMTDWLIDKEISRRVSPLMAHWASYEVVNIHPAAQWVWLRNNLIANAPGGSGKEYSVRWARNGHGVLLHPEGGSNWHADRIGALVPGVIDMALEAARRGPEPVYVAPIVWKICFRGDVSSRLQSAIGSLERDLKLAPHPGVALEARFAALQKSLLIQSMTRDGAAPPTDFPDAEFFSLKAAHAARLLEGLESRHGPSEDDRPRRLHALRRAIHASARMDAEAARRDRRALAEVERLDHFSPEHYGAPTLTQEQIAESLTQTRLALLHRGWRNALYSAVPVAVTRRNVSIRVPEPLQVTAGQGEANAPATLLRVLRDRLQSGLDRLSSALEPVVSPHRRPNPFLNGTPSSEAVPRLKTRFPESR